MQRTLVTDRFSWLWLLIGAMLLPFTQFQTVMVLAVWLAPLFLLRFARTQRALVALPALIIVHYTAAVVALRNIFPVPEVYLFGLIGVIAVANYVVDKVLTQRLTGVARTLVFPATYVVSDWLFGQAHSAQWLRRPTRSLAICRSPSLFRLQASGGWSSYWLGLPRQ